MATVSDAWIIEENIKRFRAMLAKPCDEIRRITLAHLLENEEEKLRNLRLPEGADVVHVNFRRHPKRRTSGRKTRA